MSMHEDHSDDDALAAEYVLHVLDAAERAAFETRLAAEPALRARVSDWEAQLAPLADDIAPVTPPKRIKEAVQQTLFARAPRPRPQLWGWLTGGLVAATVAVGALYLAPQFLQTAPEPSFAASVAAEDGSLLVIASFIVETNTLALTRETGAARPGRALELWLIAEGADAPVSLGVLPDTRDARLELSPELAAQMANGLLAISDEPPGGSPTGAPTGDVLAAGPVVSI